jgi:phosphopantetheinyl transferase (holo-ACP synthase)
MLAVIIDEKETGIDVEQISPRILHIKEKFMNKQELETIKKRYKAEDITLYWCVKETLYKLYGRKALRFKENLIVDPFEFLGKGRVRGVIISNSCCRKYILQYEKFAIEEKEYLITYVLNED